MASANRGEHREERGTGTGTRVPGAPEFTGPRVADFLRAPYRQVEVTGGALRYRRSGHGPPLVFLHGPLVNGNLWRKVVPLLTDRFDCVVLDLPFGSHTLPMSPGARLDPPAMARLVAEAVETLGLAPARLVGNDTGGALAQLLMAHRPEVVHDVVLTSCDTYENFLPPVFRTLPLLAKTPGGMAVLAQLLRSGGLRRLPFAYGLLTRRPIEAAALTSYVTPMRRDAAVRHDLAKALRDLDARHTLGAVEGLRRFPRRVLLAWGEYDRVFPLRHAYRLHRDLPDSELVTLPDAGAFVPEDSPVQLAELIHDFFPPGSR
ncbi:alpha/beta hydrolase [Streptomyces sp. DSM 42041]|uniref:Alpha/beta hydrolase n=1 Tax=Streptomyces hazeniae TaxID=3075538 RepID=A0ABU2NUA4_9ACTN|nr:alpha/beta hydrolase [Streptomyces sp. DSM 42041]MDT0380559.1 alpha/beta hydrolase [Streptomyces sp. DSM 42041]